MFDHLYRNSCNKGIVLKRGATSRSGGSESLNALSPQTATVVPKYFNELIETRSEDAILHLQTYSLASAFLRLSRCTATCRSNEFSSDTCRAAVKNVASCTHRLRRPLFFRLENDGKRKLGPPFHPRTLTEEGALKANGTTTAASKPLVRQKAWSRTAGQSPRYYFAIHLSYRAIAVNGFLR